jgi:AbrB family looped-hinge helix DNA binding protein
MSSSTLTSKGQTTIPKDIREYLNLQPGHRIDFMIDEEGRVLLRPATLDIRELAGILQQDRQEPISVEEMNKVIRARHGSRQ